MVQLANWFTTQEQSFTQSCIIVVLVAVIEDLTCTGLDK